MTCSCLQLSNGAYRSSQVLSVLLGVFALLFYKGKKKCFVLFFIFQIRKEREAKALIDLRSYKVFYIPTGWVQDLGDLSPILTLTLTSYTALGKLPALFS